jgi:hypothetical protein
MDANAGPGDQPATVPLRIRHIGPISLDRATDALHDLSWLGPLTEGLATHPELRQVAADLELPVLDGSSPGPLHKSTLVDIGPTRRLGDQLLMDIGWQSASFAPLFPVFAGQLVVSEHEIVLEGRYAPPLGALGLLLNQALLHFVARRSASAFVERFAREFAAS